MSDVVPTAAPLRMGHDEAAAVRRAIETVLVDGPWIGGRFVEVFEEEFARYTGSQHVVGVGNGTDALTLAILALQLPAGSSVLVMTTEGGYSASAIRAAGLVPTPMDVDESMRPSVPLMAAADHDRVTAVVVTHLHGEPLDLLAVDEWRRARGIALIEDCAQAHGARRSGRHVGLTADIAAYSFYPTKNLGAVGDAGAVATSHRHLADRVRELQQYGWGERHRIDFSAGRNSRLDPLQAAILSARLPWLDARNARRQAVASHYRRALGESPSRLFGTPGISVEHHAVVIADRREELVAHLARRGVATAIHYPYLLDEMPGLGLGHAETPAARLLRDQIVSVPCFPELTDLEVERVAMALSEWAARG